MSKTTACQTLLVMTLAFGSIAWGVQMPQAINNDRDLRSALKAAKTPEDHERIAIYYQEKADRLDAQATGYENEAQASRNAPVVKNITAPNAAARYDSMAKSLRDQAQASRQLAESQDRIARDAERASK
jgi:hypothetical protein